MRIHKIKSNKRGQGYIKVFLLELVNIYNLKLFGIYIISKIM
jgi:hypothetical protein